MNEKEMLSMIWTAITEMRDDMKVLKQEVAEIKRDLAEFKAEMYEFKQEMYEFKKEMYEFREEMNAFKKDVNLRLDRLDRGQDKMIVRVHLMETDISLLQDKITN